MRPAKQGAGATPAPAFFFFGLALGAALLAGGLACAFAPAGILEPHLNAYALAHARHGVVSAAGTRQMLLAVRLAGVTGLVLGTGVLALAWLRRWLGEDDAPEAPLSAPPPVL